MEITAIYQGLLALLCYASNEIKVTPDKQRLAFTSFRYQPYLDIEVDL